MDRRWLVCCLWLEVMHQSCCSFGVAGSCFYAFRGGTGWTEWVVLKPRRIFSCGCTSDTIFSLHKVSKTHAFSKEWGKSNNGFLLIACHGPYLFLTRRCSEQVAATEYWKKPFHSVAIPSKMTARFSKGVQEGWVSWVFLTSFASWIWLIHRQVPTMAPTTNLTTIRILTSFGG